MLSQYKSIITSFTLLNVCWLLFSGCSMSSTAITGTWMNEDTLAPHYNHILVAPFISDNHIRNDVEFKLAQQLSERDVKVERGSKFLPQKNTASTTDREAVFESVKAQKVDAILTVSLIDKEAETRYVPGSYTYTPYPTYSYYGTFSGYYNYQNRRVYEPGYYVTDHYYYLETNLYDAETEKLIWSAQTETYDPATIDSFTEDYSKKITVQLRKDSII